MPYRVCKVFEVESGHMLSKHPDRCRFPHGHSRRIEVVVSSDRLDANDMVCDFKAIKLAVGELIDSLDHSMAINSDDPSREHLESTSERVVVFRGQDPTTEVLAKYIYDHLEACLASGKPVRDDRGNQYALPSGLRVERIRVGETSSTWAHNEPG